MIVKRYSFYASSVADCEGDYVLHSDYAALEARCAGIDGKTEALDKENIVMRRQMERLIDERDAAVAAKERAVESLRKVIFCIDHDNLAEESSWLQMEFDKARAALADTTTGEVQP